MARLEKVAPGKVLQLKISLLEVEPTVWRRLVVPSDITLAKLHRILQIAMGWTDSHMHQFHVGKVNARLKRVK